MVTYLVLGWWLFENAALIGRCRLGFGVVGGGWALNPLGSSRTETCRSPDLHSTAPHSFVDYCDPWSLGQTVPMNHGTILRVLGDDIPLSWFRSVVSPGDIVMAVGIGVLVAAAMRADAANADFRIG